MKEWKIVIGIPGKIIVGDIRVESNMVDARTHSVLNRKISSRSASGSDLSLNGFMKLTDVIISEHNNKDYQESRKYKEFLFKKNDIFFVYDENQPKSTTIEDTAAPTTDLIKKKTHLFELTTKTVGNSYYQIKGHFTGFLKHFEDNDFIQLKNVSITEFLKREDGFLKLKYDKKSFVSVNTKILEAVAEVEETG
ncbi:MAG: hypothetical protein ABFR36_07305 [Acidobacteriota bacterium]